MKKKLILILGLNIIILTSIIILSPSSTNAESVKRWDDEWNICRYDGVPSSFFREHSCFDGLKYVICIEQDCTLGIYLPD